MSQPLTVDDLKAHVGAFTKVIEQARTEIAPRDFEWYPYGSLSNIVHLDNLLKGPYRDLGKLTGGKPIADIGAADGDLAFFLERQGCSVHIIDYGPTNHNHLQGAKALRKKLRSRVAIHDVDLDAQFRLPKKSYGLVIFLGILYHLKNPFYALETLANAADYCVVSTRVMRYSPDHKLDFSNYAVSYLVGERELNNDPTNFWVFSHPGLKRLCERAGWEIVSYLAAGDTERSTPSSMQHDERAFALLRSARRPRSS